ncbi:MAG: hypothetical protein LBE06_08910 [Azoarcus sp.]|jgi:hypothetical protein|nr:hypothetical protein [Azoarcus sp.]
MRSPQSPCLTTSFIFNDLRSQARELLKGPAGIPFRFPLSERKVQKMLKTSLGTLAATVALGLASQTAQAAPVSWADWVSIGNASASGVIDIGNETIGLGLSSSSPLADASHTGDGINYWATNPSTYQSPVVDNAPGGSDIIALNLGGTVTITFTGSVHNPILALASWNGNHVEFATGTQIEYLGSGSGYWGEGSFGNTTASSFEGTDELHGIIQLVGDFTSITFTHTGEYWHGLTVGTAVYESTTAERTKCQKS